MSHVWVQLIVGFHWVIAYTVEHLIYMGTKEEYLMYVSLVPSGCWYEFMWPTCHGYHVRSSRWQKAKRDQDSHLNKTLWVEGKKGTHINLGLADQILSPFWRKFYCLNGIACNIFYVTSFFLNTGKLNSLNDVEACRSIFIHKPFLFSADGESWRVILFTSSVSNVWCH